MEPIYIALIAGLQLIALAVVQAYINGRKDTRDAAIRAAEKAADYARQDLVAERVAAAATKAAEQADLLVKAQADTIARTDEVARLAAAERGHMREQLVAISEQGNKIHTLVNSDMTAARTQERDQTLLLLIALRQVAALNTRSGVKPMPEEQDAIIKAQKRITELDIILADRHAAQTVIDEEIKKRESLSVPASPVPIPVVIVNTPLETTQKKRD